MVTPEFVKTKDLDVGLIQDLNDHNGCIPLSSCGGSITNPWVMLSSGYKYLTSRAITKSKLPWWYSPFMRKCPVMLATPMINQAIRAMKESKLEDAAEPWQSARYLYKYAHYMAQLDLKEYGITMPTNTRKNPTDLDEIVFLKKKFTIPAFESAILHCCTHKTMMMGYKLIVSEWGLCQRLSPAPGQLP